MLGIVHYRVYLMTLEKQLMKRTHYNDENGGFSNIKRASKAIKWAFPHWLRGTQTYEGTSPSSKEDGFDRDSHFDSFDSWIMLRPQRLKGYYMWCAPVIIWVINTMNYN